MGKTDELKDKVNEAYAAVADISKEEIKLEGFKLVLTSLLSQAFVQQPGSNLGLGSEVTPPSEPSTDWQTAIAARLHISGVQAAKLYHSDDNQELRLILDTSILPKKSQALATQHIAALICAGRQAAKLDGDGYTSFDVIRAECVEYGVLNKSNFTGYLKKMKPKFIVEGKGKNQSMRVTAQGFDEAAEIAKKYLGQEK